jgi:ribosomal protein L11 methyltransferase
VGCGSGILTLAAAQLGYCSLTAFDNDPQAIIAAEENLTNADIRQSVHLFESDLQTAPALETFDVVIANILAHILREHTAYICDRIKRSGGHLIIAGILEEQYTETLAAFQKTEPALKEIKRESIDGWASGLLRLTAENSEQNTVG